MKRPTIKITKIRKSLRNKPVLARLYASLLILFFPLLGTITLWREHGDEIFELFRDMCKVVVGNWEE